MSVFITDLDDFVNLGQACVNPFVNNKSDKEKDGKKSTGKVKLDLAVDNTATEYDIKPDLIKTRTSTASSSSESASKIASVSLADCLACSGCVTTAESVLIQQHGYQKLLDKCSEDSDSLVVVSISPQSLASLVVFLLGSPDKEDASAVTQDAKIQLFLQISAALKSLGVRYVCSSDAVSALVLLESGEEFVHRYRLDQEQLAAAPAAPTEAVARSKAGTRPVGRSNAGGRVKGAVNAIATPMSNALSATEVQWVLPAGVTPTPAFLGGLRGATAPRRDENGNTFIDTEPGLQCVASVTSGAGAGPGLLPLLASQCPGFVCYAEKTQPDMLRHMSTVKSAQQVLGTVLKYGLLDEGRETEGFAACSVPEPKVGIFHVSVQPCFDKKLEASRKDFIHGVAAETETETDLVLSTTELWNLIEHLAAGKAAQAAAKGEESSERVRISDYLQSLVADAVGGVDAVEAALRHGISDDSGLGMGSTNAGSGGYIEFVSRYAAQRLWGLDLWSVPLQFSVSTGASSSVLSRPLLQEDYAECVISNIRGVLPTPDAQAPESILDGEQFLVFAKAYGFRCIQSVATKLRRSRCLSARNFPIPLRVSYLEVMACPGGGCLNGGGQIKQRGTESVQTRNRRVAATAAAFHSAEELLVGDPVVRLLQTPVARTIYGGAGWDDADASEKPMEGVFSDSLSVPLLHTRYHAVPRLDILVPATAKW